MSFLIDSDVAIHIRDGHEATLARTAALDGSVSLSLATLIELQGGLAVAGPMRERRRAGLLRLLARYPVVPLDRAVVEEYGALVRTAGFSRTRIFDRLIAATAIVHDLTLVTINGPDFREVPSLKLEVWPTADQ